MGLCKRYGCAKGCRGASENGSLGQKVCTKESSVAQEELLLRCRELRAL